MSLYDFTEWVNKLEQQLNQRNKKIAEEIVKELNETNSMRCGQAI